MASLHSYLSGLRQLLVRCVRGGQSGSFGDLDGDGYTSDVDCNDNDPLQHPNQIWNQDMDGDGYSNGNIVIQCQRPAFYKAASELTVTSGDCNDNNPAIKPGATDACDSVDNDCNGTTDDGYVPTNTTCGLGDCAATGQNICQSGTVVDTCTPGLPTENPELNCNDNKDNDCDGFTDGNDTDCNVFIPDLAVTYIGNLPASKKRGSSFIVKDTVKNTGGARAGRFVMRYYLSLDTIKDGNDILLKGNRIALKLKAGKNSIGKTTLTIPKKTPPDNYYLIACADDTNKVSESNETDNCTASQTTINVK